MGFAADLVAVHGTSGFSQEPAKRAAGYCLQLVVFHRFQIGGRQVFRAELISQLLNGAGLLLGRTFLQDRVQLFFQGGVVCQVFVQPLHFFVHDDPPVH